MARAPRIHVPGLLYHVICRGNQKGDVFLDEQDFRAYILRISEAQLILPFKLYAYALMSNHVHMLLEISEAPLSQVMQIIQQRYTQYFNMKYNKIGHAFQGRYKAIVCQKDAYLLELVRYIHLNPVRAGIVQKPEDYPWTGHKGYMAQKADPWLERDAILMLFGKETESAQARYEDFVMGGLGQGHKDELYELKQQQVLGSDDFVDTLPLGISRSRDEEQTDEKLLKSLKNRVCEAFDLKIDDLLAPNSRNSGIPRAALCLLAHKNGIKIPDVAASIGISANTLRQTLYRYRNKAASHPAFTKL
ncbi:MAG TPA: transposase [bacterium]|nr:transposase [bacterium]